MAAPLRANATSRSCWRFAKEGLSSIELERFEVGRRGVADARGTTDLL